MEVKHRVLERKRQFLAARLVQAHFRGYRWYGTTLTNNTRALHGT